MKGKIKAIYPAGHSSVYSYTCLGEDGLFSFPVEFRYPSDILENEGDPVGREVEYRDDQRVLWINDPAWRGKGYGKLGSWNLSACLCGGSSVHHFPRKACPIPVLNNTGGQALNFIQPVASTIPLPAMRRDLRQA